MDAPLTLRQLARALAWHVVHTSLAHTVREVSGSSPSAPTRQELIETLAAEIEAVAREPAAPCSHCGKPGDFAGP
jgi:hypothetical protein